MLREDFRQQIHFRSIVRLEQFTPMCPKRNSIMKKEGDFTLFFLLSHISLHDSPLTVADKHDNFIPFSGSRHFSFYSFDSIGVVKTRLIKNALNILDFINFLV